MKHDQAPPVVAGWIFFAVALAVCVPAGIWLIMQYTYDTLELPAKIVVGGFLGAAVAGMATWILDLILARVQSAKHAAIQKEREAEKRSGRPH